MTPTVRRSNAIRFRGRSFMALALAPEPPIADWLVGLDALLARSQGFFAGKPILLDVTALRQFPLDLPGLVVALQSRGIRILGIEGADPASIGPGLPPVMTGVRPASEIEEPESESKDRTSKCAESLLVQSPVRSGQSIIYPDGDVTVLNSVASGAEIVAGGSIHVYGALRGRAIAGSSGNASARIYCTKLEAELLAIDGFYKTADDLDQQFRGRSAQIWLDGDKLLVAGLS